MKFDEKNKNKKYTITVLIFLTVAVIFLFPQCSDNREKIYRIETFHGSVLINNVTPQEYQVLKNFDLLQVKDSSYCILKNSNCIMLICGKSEVTFVQVDDSTNGLSVNLNKGFITIYTEKLYKNAHIQTPHTTIKGDFKYLCVMTEDDAVNISCIDGKLNTTYVVNNNEYSRSVTSKKQLLIARSIHEYADIPIYLLQNYESMVPLFFEDDKKDAIIRQFLHDRLLRYSNLNIKEEIELAMIAHQKGQLSKVITTNGTMYKGWVMAKGNVLSITSINGTVEIPQKIVKYVLHLTPMYNDE